MSQFRLALVATVGLGLATPAFAQDPAPPPPPVTPASPQAGEYPKVTFGVQSFLQYSALLHEADGYNAFEVTRGYLNVEARLSDRLRFRFTPDVRPTTDASLENNLTLRLEYASLYATVADDVTLMFGLHETPWLSYEESINRYRVLGPFFSERLGLVPGPTDLGVSVRATRGNLDVHGGVYNGEGYGRAEIDRYKSVEGRVSYRLMGDDSVQVSGFYQYGWYARDRPRNVAIVMGSYEQPHGFVTAQYLWATDNPFIARDVQRRGLSIFGEVRQGPTGWAGIAGLDLFDPDRSDDGDSTRRMVFGGAHWRRVGQARLGIVVSLEQSYRSATSQLTDRRLLAQTTIEF
ncbi:MAG: hypothetical protein R2752_21825 [Vicinamibacterales bacterium]